MSFNYYLLLILLYSVQVHSNNLDDNNNNKVMHKIYSSISNNHYKKISSNSAVFNKEGATWTILGAIQKSIVNYDKTITVKTNKDLEISILDSPISKQRILPFSYPIQDTTSTNVINVTAAGDEYEPFSFVIRAGNADIRNIQISSSNLLFKEHEINSENIDIKVVKPWYQSAGSIHRGVDGGKRLVPELLLKDDSLVKTNHQHQVNLLRNYAHINDSDKLMSFDIPKDTNKQIWATVYIDTNTESGQYKGTIQVTYTTNNKTQSQAIPVVVNVLPFNLGKPAIHYSLYYLARVNKNKKVKVSSRSKNIEQITYELKDMKEHGLTNVALDYGHEKHTDGTPDLRPFTIVASKTKEIFNNENLLFVDWHLEGFNKPKTYKLKLKRIKEKMSSLGFSKIFIYNFDEAPLNKIIENKHTLESSHDIGLKNFSATKPQFIPFLDSYFDVFVLHRNSLLTKKAAKYTNNKIWAYNDPQGGEEKPKLYRTAYGTSLWFDYFDGACNYAYQTGQPGWNDWADPKWRPHNMTYPTINKPVSTLQWEGWREGIDDSRYLQVLLDLYKPDVTTDRIAWFELITGVPHDSEPKILREAIIKAINEFNTKIKT